jgi:O-antigen/teichoic acid export membrane protein
LPPLVAILTAERIVARNFLTLAAGEFGAALVAATTTVYLARQLGVTAYGLVGVCGAIMLYFSACVDGGIEFLGPREIAADRAAVERIVPTILWLRVVVASALASALAVVGVFALPRPDGVVLSAYGITLLSAAVSTRWIHLGLESPGVVAGSRLLLECVELAVVLLLVRVPADVMRVPFAEFAGGIAAAGLLAMWTRRRGVRLTGPLDFAAAQPVLRRARPLMFTKLIGLVIYNSDLLIVRFFRGQEAAGLYMAAYTLIRFLGVLGAASRLSLLPALTRLRGVATPVAARQFPRVAETARELYHAALAQLFALGFPVAVGGFLLAPKIIATLFGLPYGASAALLAVLIWSVPLLLLRGVSQTALVAGNRPDLVLRMNGGVAVLSVLLNCLLIPVFGSAGAAAVTVAAEAVRFLVAQYDAARQGFPVAGGGRYWRVVVAGGMMALALRAADPPSLWLGVAFGGVVYTAALTLLGGLRIGPDRVPTLRV